MLHIVCQQNNVLSLNIDSSKIELDKEESIEK